MSARTSDLQQSIALMVQEELTKQFRTVPVGISNRHVHLCREDMDVLFGQGSQLTVKKMLGQPGQYAAEEMVALVGPKGRLEKVRVLGPLRKDTQVEISATDGRTLGVNAPVRESGKVKGTPGIRLIGPCGETDLKEGTIVALRHIHMTPYLAEQMNLSDGAMIDVELGDEQRGGVMSRVLIRVSDSYAPEMHIDVDEANAFGVKNDDAAKIL